jgi:hypothetical protein
MEFPIGLVVGFWWAVAMDLIPRDHPAFGFMALPAIAVTLAVLASVVAVGVMGVL